MILIPYGPCIGCICTWVQCSWRRDAEQEDSLGERRFNYTQKNMADAFGYLAYVKYVYLPAVLIERSASIFIQRVFLPYVR